MPNPHSGADCPVARTLGLIGDHWSMLIIREAFDGPIRYERIRASLGISDNTLSRRLTNLVDHELLTHNNSPDGVRAHYELTEAGRQLAPVLAVIGAWGSRWLPEPGPDRMPPAAVGTFIDAASALVDAS